MRNSTCTALDQLLLCISNHTAILIAAVFSIGMASFAFGQQTGFVPFATYAHSDFDSINIAQGTVSLHIPLVRYPQKGTLPPLGIDLVFNSPYWEKRVNNTQCSPSFGCSSNYDVTFANPNTSRWLSVNPSYIGSYVDDTINCTEEGCQACTNTSYCQFSLPAFTDASGATHVFYNVATADGTPTGMMASTDGSGLMGKPNTAGGVTPNTIIDKNGIAYDVTDQQFLMKDPSGNQVTYSSSGLVDSIGRPIPFFPAMLSSASVGCNTQSFPAFAGQTAQISVCWQTYTATSGSTLNLGNASTSYLGVSSITLPNGQEWQFSYDSWGSLYQLTLPTGALVTYNYYPPAQYSGNCEGPGSSCTFTRRLNTRAVSADGITNTWTYSADSSGAQIVTDPAQNQTSYSFGNGCQSTQCPYELSQTYKDSAGNVLRTVATGYSYLGNVTPSSPGSGRKPPENSVNIPETYTTTLDNGQVSQTCMISDNNINSSCTAGSDSYDPAGLRYYDPNYAQFFPNYPTVLYPLVLGSVGHSYVFDFGATAPGAMLKHEAITYKWQTASAYQASNLLNLVVSDTLLDPNSMTLANTTFGYDETAGGSPAGVYGNQTSVTRSLQGGNSLMSSTKYNTQGMPLSVTDPNGGVTTTVYDGTGAYPFTVTQPTVNGIALVNQYVYDASTGLMASHTDSNQNVTTYDYDTSNRPGKTTHPTGGGVEQYNYQDVVGSSGFTYTRTINRTQTYSVQGMVDELGRKKSILATSDPLGSEIDTYYDSLGRVSAVSNAYSTMQDVTYGVVSSTYDVLNRLVRQCNQDNGTGIQCPTSGPSMKTWTYNGNTTKIANELGFTTIQVTDALGRVTGVTEPGGLTTSYLYDGLNNLSTVNQSGNGSTDAPRVRRFSYDWLSRLVTASNPETGTICYGVWSGTNCINGYDAGGNLQYKTDARGVTTSYYYDLLHRMIAKSYPAGTASSCYQYDKSTVPGAASNLLGRLTNSWTQSGVCPVAPPGTGTLSRRSDLAYDSMGRLLSEQQCTLSNCASTAYSPAYTYDFAGNLHTQSSGLSGGPGSFVFTNSYDATNRLISVVSSNTQYPAGLFSTTVPQAPAGCGQTNAVTTPPGYNAAGQLMYATLGTGLVLQRSYDVRLHMNCELDYGNQVSGTPGTATITINGTDQTH